MTGDCAFLHLTIIAQLPSAHWSTCLRYTEQFCTVFIRVLSGFERFWADLCGFVQFSYGFRAVLYGLYGLYTVFVRCDSFWMKYGNRTEEGKGRGKKLIGPTVAFFVPPPFYLTEEFFPLPRVTPKLSGCEVRRSNKYKFVQLFIFFINILRPWHCSSFGRASFKGPSLVQLYNWLTWVRIPRQASHLNSFLLRRGVRW